MWPHKYNIEPGSISAELNAKMSSLSRGRDSGPAAGGQVGDKK
jgi:hypothetical protein